MIVNKPDPTERYLNTTTTTMMVSRCFASVVADYDYDDPVVVVVVVVTSQPSQRSSLSPRDVVVDCVAARVGWWESCRNT